MDPASWIPCAASCLLGQHLWRDGEAVRLLGRLLGPARWRLGCSRATCSHTRCYRDAVTWMSDVIARCRDAYHMIARSRGSQMYRDAFRTTFPGQSHHVTQRNLGDSASLVVSRQCSPCGFSDRGFLETRVENNGRFSFSLARAPFLQGFFTSNF